jgi:hypothetical protein
MSGRVFELFETVHPLPLLEKEGEERTQHEYYELSPYH